MRLDTAFEVFCTRIFSFSKNHPSVWSLMLSVALVVSLYVVYTYVVNLYPPKTIGDYVIYIEYTDHYVATHRYMFPAIYGSLIFLVSSLSYLNRKMIETFERLKKAIEKPEELSNRSIKLASSRYRYLFAFVMGLLLLWGPTWITFGSFEIVYINFPAAAIISFVYFLIAFLSAIGLWLIFTSIYFINIVAGQQFRIDIEDLRPWIDDDEIGGLKKLSDFSSRIFGLIILGILFFSPAALLYGMMAYAGYVFALIPIALFFLLITQRILHKAIIRHKERFYELAEKKRDSGEITLAEYLATLLAIKVIKDRPINLSMLWGIFISSIVLPTLFLYVSMMLRELMGIVIP